MSSLQRYRELEGSGSQELTDLQEKSTRRYYEVQKKNEESLSNPFEYFYSDVVSASLGFMLSDKLPSNETAQVNSHSSACIKLVRKFNGLPLDDTLYSWIQRAIKLTDHLALDYIQRIKGVTPIPSVRRAGIERSRYRQISDFKDAVSVAGQNMDKLYGVRSSLEHRTETDPSGNQSIIMPDYRWARAQIKRLFPPTLKGFRNALYNN